MADLYTNLALAGPGVTPYHQIRSGKVSRTISLDIPLSAVETWPDWDDRETISCIYNCGFVAVELLASYVGLGRLVDFYTMMQPGTDWRQTFEKAYGMTDCEFYELFEEHRVAGFPDPKDGKVARDASLPGNRPASPDRQALVALFNATRGLNWKESEGWLTNTPISEWHGVTADCDGRVVELSLGGNQLSGEIPAELGNLQSLQGLNLESNHLSGRIPAELGNLTNLQLLLLGGNQLSGEMPAELGKLQSLRGLNLEGNQLSGEIPAEFGNLTNLQWAALGWNQLSGEIPVELGNLTRLDMLNLNNNRLTGCVPSSLQGQFDPAYDPGMPFC